jgi:hypothetical protein
MTAKEWATKVDPSRVELSLLIVTSKRSFIDWIKSFMVKQGLGEYDVYFPEQDSVWLIPKIERFSKPGSYEEFIDEIKPRLLLAELYNYGAVEADFGHPITKETFDEFFDLTLRNEATPISVLFK